MTDKSLPHHHPSRRSFLAATAASAATLSTARLVHSQEPAAQDASPNAKMNAAIIGCGGRGGSHIEEMLRADNVTITHICEVDASIADKRAAELGVTVGCSGMEALLAFTRTDGGERRGSDASA